MEPEWDANSMFTCGAVQDTLGAFYHKGLGVGKVKINQVAYVITYGSCVDLCCMGKLNIIILLIAIQTATDIKISDKTYCGNT